MKYRLAVARTGKSYIILSSPKPFDLTAIKALWTIVLLIKIYVKLGLVKLPVIFGWLLVEVHPRQSS